MNLFLTNLALSGSVDCTHDGDLCLQHSFRPVGPDLLPTSYCDKRHHQDILVLCSILQGHPILSGTALVELL